MFPYARLTSFGKSVIHATIHLRPFGLAWIMLGKVKWLFISKFIDAWIGSKNSNSSCKPEQHAFEQCAKSKMSLERPESGYFSMVRMHDTKRPVPAHPPKMEVPDPPLVAQANEYPEARLGMKFGTRKPWLFESKLWD